MHIHSFKTSYCMLGCLEKGHLKFTHIKSDELVQPHNFDVLKGWVPWTERTIPLDAVLKAPRTKLLFLWRVDMIFMS